MADLDLEDLDGPSRAPARPSRFAPKGSKLKPKVEPKAEPKTEPKAEPKADGAAEVELEASRPDDVVLMDVDAKPEAFPKDETMEYKESMECKEEEGDTVVREIDVYFTPPVDPNSKVYVLQYPLRPVWRPYDLDERCKEVRVKAGHAEMEVDLAVDEDSNNYDKDADHGVKMNKQTLTTSWELPKSTAYAVGILIGNKVLSVPEFEGFSVLPPGRRLHNKFWGIVVQLRPSTKHLMRNKQKSGTNSSLEDAINPEEGTDKKSGGSSKQPKSTAPSNEQNKDTTENWMPLKYHGMRSDASARCLQDMVRQDDSPLQFSMSRSDYVDSLCPVAFNGGTSSKGLWERLLLTPEEPWQEHLKAWLVEGPPIHRFNTLKHLAPDASVKEFLGELRKHACLVQGLWVPKTLLLYKQGTGENVFARDYILLLFSENPLIKNSQLQGNRHHQEIMRGVLDNLAFKRASLGDWKFKEPTDFNFIKLNPDIFEEEQAAWKQFKVKADAMLGNQRSMMKNSAKLATANNPSKSSSKQASKNSSGVDTRMPMPEETREALTHALQKLFHMQKVCSSQQICQRLRDMALSESIKPKGSKEALIAALGVDNPSKELQAIISEVCVNIHGVYVLKSSPDNPESDEFRKVVIDLFLAQGPNAKIKKASIKEAASLKLQREIKDPEYLKVVQELCVSQNSAWVLKSGEGNSR